MTVASRNRAGGATEFTFSSRGDPHERIHDSKTTLQQNQRLSEIAVKPTFRIIDGVSIRFVKSNPRHVETGTLDNWDPGVTDSLASRREVVLFDNAGIGRSSRKVPNTIGEMAEHALAFLDGPGPCYLRRPRFLAWRDRRSADGT